MEEALFLHAASAINADQYAVAGFLAGDAFDYVEVDGRRVLFVTGFERELAIRESGAEAIAVEDLGLRELLASGRPRSEIGNQLSVNGLRQLGVERVVVPDWFPLGLAEHLRASGIPVRSQPELLTDRRRRKTPEQVDAIREAQAVTERSFALIARTLAGAEVGDDGTLHSGGEPLTSEALHGAIRLQWAGDGCEGATPIVSGGAQSAEPHELGHGPLRAGEAILCDLFPRTVRRRYFADMTRTFCVGEPPALLVELQQVVERALHEAVAAAGPGISGAELHRRCSDLFFAEGYHTLEHPAAEHGREDRAGFIHALGHGLGLDVHEMPAVGPSGRELLEPGDVITIEPGLYLPGFGGVRLEDLVVITEDGCENLTSFPYGLAPSA